MVAGMADTEVMEEVMVVMEEVTAVMEEDMVVMVGAMEVMEGMAADLMVVTAEDMVDMGDTGDMEAVGITDDYEFLKMVSGRFDIRQ